MTDGTIINPFPSITFSEIVDIIVVATLLYTAVVWAQRTRAALVVRGILVFGGIYIVARYMDLQMTAWLFQGFFAIFLIMIVVIFQEELRRFFEQIAVWSFNFKDRRTISSGTTNVLARTLLDMAKERIGALIVIRGKDPLERHITGGIALRGHISTPLLRSIFDPHSPGHDGAVLIERDRVMRFAAHLPLSKDLVQTAHVGTRHSAALGLAELTDALCLVVSEERGQVSIAHESRLRALDNPQELAGAIDRYINEKFPVQQTKHIPVALVRKNWVAKAVSLSLAIGFWYIFVPGSKTVQVTYEVPVKVENLPATMAVEQLEPAKVQATFSGPRRSFYLFNAQRVQVTVDVAMAELGRRTFTISEQNIRYPKELVLQDLAPTSLKLSVQKVEAPAKTGEGKPPLAAKSEPNDG